MDLQSGTADVIEEGTPVALSNIRTRRLVAAGALAVASAAAPMLFATATAQAVPDLAAGPKCLAWFGNKEDGKCLSYSNGSPVLAGTPDFGVYGPASGSKPGGGVGVVTGPLLPGTTWTQSIG